VKKRPRKKQKKIAVTKLSQPRGSRVPARRITRAGARRLAAQHAVKAIFRGSTVKDGAEAGLRTYALPKLPAGKDVWVVYLNDENPMILKSSEIVVICKRTGRVLYAGSACDEG